MEKAFDEEYYEDVDEELPGDDSSIDEVQIPKEIKEIDQEPAEAVG